MKDEICIKLAAQESEDKVSKLENELSNLREIKGIEVAEGRGIIDPDSFRLGLELTQGLLSSVAIAIPLVMKLIKVIKGKEIKGATIELPNGAKISVDSASASDIEQLLQAVDQDR